VGSGGRTLPCLWGSGCGLCPCQRTSSGPLPDRGHVDRLLDTISPNRREKRDTCHFDIGSMELKGRRRIRRGGYGAVTLGDGQRWGGEEGIIEFMGGRSVEDERRGELNLYRIFL
jgi:hypothetical protein